MTTSQTDPMIGRLIDGRYQVRSRIARGGMATVYLATDLRLERRVAIKVMHGHLSDDTTFKNRFVQEARSAARLAHPNVVSVFDQGQDSDMAYLVMEYLPGITLRDLLKERGRLTAQQTVDIMHAVLSGLAAAHQAGIVHRDVKPENVLLADDGRIKIGDFGLARAASANTATGQALLGTIAYLSPELVTRGIADARSDIYALGIMLYEMLVGEQPFTGEQPMQIAYQHANDSVPYPSARVASVPRQLDELVLWATERDPEMRPHDAKIMLDQLLEAERTMGEVPPDRSRVTQAQTAVLPPSFDALIDGDTAVVPDGALQSATPASRGVRPAGGATPSTSALGPGSLLGADSPAAAALARKTKRRRRTGVVILVLILLAAIGVGYGSWYFGAGPGAIVRVPDVSGQSAEQATAALTGLDLEVETAQANDLNVPVGTVLSSDPGHDAQVQKGSVVTIVLSAGPRMIDVPDLVGMSETDAGSTVTNTGFVLGSVTKYFDDEAPAGTVTAQTGADGGELPDQLAEQQVIALVVSLGAIPDVTGATIDEATQTMTDAGLALVRADDEFSSDVPAGTVISQVNPEAPATTGANVTVTVSKGPEPIAVPTVIGMTRDDAKTALRNAGFEVGYAAGWDVIPNIATEVFGVDQAAGTLLPPGTKITLSIKVVGT